MYEKVKKLDVVVVYILILIISWLYIYIYDYSIIPSSLFFKSCYRFFVFLVFAIPIYMIAKITYLIKIKAFKIKVNISCLIFYGFIFIFSILILAYNRHEYISYKEYNVQEKYVSNGDYYVIVDNETILKCTKKIYTNIIPNNKYIFTFRSNSLNIINTKKLTFVTKIKSS